jgi:hypothetical protein
MFKIKTDGKYFQEVEDRWWRLGCSKCAKSYPKDIALEIKKFLETQGYEDVEVIEC